MPAEESDEIDVSVIVPKGVLAMVHDGFVCAALTGLLSDGLLGRTHSSVVADAYRIADEAMRVRNLRAN